MRKIKLLFQYFEMFVLSVLVLGLTLLCVLKFTILDKNYVLSMYDEKHYKEVEEFLKSEMQKSMISTGISSSVIDDMFTASDVKKSTEEVLSILYDDNKQKLDVSSIEEKLRSNIDKDLKEKQFTLSDTEGYEEFVKSIMDIYKGEFLILNQTMKISKGIHLVNKYLNLAIIILGILILIYLVILILRKKFLQYVPVSLFFTSFLIIFSIYYSDVKVGFRNITIISESFSEIIRKIISTTFQVCLILVVVYLILGIILILFQRGKKKVKS